MNLSQVSTTTCRAAECLRSARLCATPPRRRRTQPHKLPSRIAVLHTRPARQSRPQLRRSAITPKAEDSQWEGRSPEEVLGVAPGCLDVQQIKAAFRARVKQYHPDLNAGSPEDYTGITARLVQAYEVLLDEARLWAREQAEAETRDPFAFPEAEATCVFVNELGCLGRGCSEACVRKVPDAFAFAEDTGAARWVGPRRMASQDDDLAYVVYLAQGQCPTLCIHYVTPRQLAVLESILKEGRGLGGLTAARGDELYGLLAKASFENRRYQAPGEGTRGPVKRSTKWVDWY